MNLSSKKLLSVAVVALAAALMPAASLADSTVPANVQADIAKTAADVQTLHDTIVADAAKIQSDVAAVSGATDKKAALATLKADWQKLQADRKSENATIKADWEQLKADVKAAHEAKLGEGQIKPLVQAMHTANQALRADLQQTVKAARDATKALKESLKSQPHPAGQGDGQGTGATTPPAPKP